MAIQIRIPKIFRPRSRVVATPTVETVPDVAPPPRETQQKAFEESIPVTFMKSDIPEIDSAYGYGHLDGRRGTSPEPFEAFIGHTVESDAAERQLILLREREHNLRGEAAELRRQQGELVAQQQELTRAAERAAEHRQRLLSADADLESARQAEAATKPEGAMRLYALVYGVAGLCFIAADVVVSRSIVADAMEMTGFDAWAFAIGLAMISILIKPAYDRLVEEPFWEGKERRFALVIGCAALLAMGTLATLGAFRSEAHQRSVQIEMLEANEDMPIEQKAAEVEVHRAALLASPLGKASFVLSGVLFAIAGAVCVGISLRHLQGYRHTRRPVLKRVKRLSLEVNGLRATTEVLRDDATRRAVEMERLRVSLTGRPEPIELESQADALISEQSQVLAMLGPIRTERLRSLYRDGYGLGQVMARDSAAAAPPLSSSRRSSDASDGPRRKRARPYVALRRAIREATLRPGHSS